jgi:tetratricopeptide (TPR) repeat protein
MSSAAPSPSRQTPSPNCAESLRPVILRFDTDWQAGSRPRLEDFLAEVAPADRLTLLYELLARELAHRHRLGERPTGEEYRLRLPEYAAAINEVFGLLSTEVEVAAPPGVAGTHLGRAAGLTDSGAGVAGLSAATSGERPKPAYAGRYEIGSEIARGGMGVVWLGRDTELNRPLAIKVLRAEYRGHPDLERRFREEAQITGQLQHPGIPPVHEVGTLPDGRPFIAMKLIEGRTLAELLGERVAIADGLPHFLGVFEHICQTVAYAHSRGVIHRDLKPANVMVGAFGEVQVMDWGLAKLLGPSNPAEGAGEARILTTPRTTGLSPSSQAGTVLGTPAYMAPEQARGDIDQLDARCDVFGLGGMLCAILTGEPPFSGPTEEALQRAATGDLADTFARLEASGADAELRRLARACLAPAPQDRPQDAGTVAQALGAYLTGVQERLREAERQRAGAEARAVEERKRRRVTLALAGAMLLLVLAGAGAAWWFQQQRAAALARQREAGQNALLTLERARSLMQKGWKTQDLDKLKDAKAEADRAVDIAHRGEAPAAVRQEAAKLQKEARDRMARTEKNRLLLNALLDVSAFRETHPFTEGQGGGGMVVAQLSMDEQIQAAFRRWGLDMKHSSAGEIVARLREEPEPVLQEILAGLDVWMLERRVWDPSGAQWRRLLAVTGELDRSGVRREFRALLVGEPPPRHVRIVDGLTRGLLPWTRLWELDRGKDWRRLLEFRAHVDPATEPALSVVLLALACAGGRDPAGAEDVLRQAIAARPDQVALLITLGWLLEMRGRPEAIECYSRARSLRPQLGIALSAALARAGRGTECEAVLRALLRQEPNNPQLHFYLGQAFSALGKPRDAMLAYREAIRLDPEFAAAQNNLGIALHAQGKVGQATAAYRAVIRLEPNSPKGHYNLGNALREQKKLHDAIAAYKKAVRLKPDFAKGHNNLGLALLDVGQLAEAVAAHQKAVSLKRDDPALQFNLGNALERLGKRAEAAAAYREALRLNPTFADAYYNLGIALEADSKPSEAIAAFRNALRLKPAFPEAQYNLGRALQQLGKLAEAAAAYKEAIRLRPHYSKAYHNLALVRDDQRRLADAVAAFKEAVRLEPSSASAHKNLGIALVKQDRFAEAAGAFKEAIRLDPEDPVLHSKLGAVLLQLGKVPEAVAAYRHALRLERDDPEAHNGLGVALVRQGKLGEGVTAFENALRLNPKSARAHFNLGMAFRDQGKFRAALDSLRTAHKLGAHLPDWPSTQYAAVMRSLPHFAEEDRKLAAFLDGKRKVTDPAEQLLLAAFCRHPGKRLYALSARFYADAFRGQPALAENLRFGCRSDAAGSAALAGCGRGEDEPRPDEKERARLRRQALDWLRADLAAWGKQLETKRAAVLRVLTRWGQDPDLRGVRDTEELKRLPQDEREGWESFWAEVAALRKRAEPK